MSPQPDDAFLSGCDDDILGGADPLPDDETDLFVLFAEALDPESPVTVEDVERTWGVR